MKHGASGVAEVSRIIISWYSSAMTLTMVFLELQSMTISIVSYMGKVRIAVGTEKGFIDPRKFNACIENAFQRVFEAALGTPPPPMPWFKDFVFMVVIFLHNRSFCVDCCVVAYSFFGHETTSSSTIVFKFWRRLFPRMTGLKPFGSCSNVHDNYDNDNNCLSCFALSAFSFYLFRRCLNMLLKKHTLKLYLVLKSTKERKKNVKKNDLSVVNEE